MMKKCQKQIFRWFGFKHSFIIVNAFTTLMDQNFVDVIKVCSICNKRETFLLDKDTLKETINKFPNAFDNNLRSFIELWI